jgi:predicted nucleic acid-binding Zn ribbon protein
MNNYYYTLNKKSFCGDVEVRCSGCSSLHFMTSENFEKSLETICPDCDSKLKKDLNILSSR